MRGSRSSRRRPPRVRRRPRPRAGRDSRRDDRGSRARRRRPHPRDDPVHRHRRLDRARRTRSATELARAARASPRRRRPPRAGATGDAWSSSSGTERSPSSTARGAPFACAQTIANDPGAPELTVRAGLHTGEVELIGDDARRHRDARRGARRLGGRGRRSPRRRAPCAICAPGPA